MPDSQLPGRPPLRVSGAAAATSPPLAPLPAVEVIRDGGNAIDAAVAAAAVLAVVEPQSTGIGGDCFILYAPGGEAQVIAFNGSGRSPHAAQFGWDSDPGFRGVPTYGPPAVPIPRALHALARI